MIRMLRYVRWLLTRRRDSPISARAGDRVFSIRVHGPKSNQGTGWYSQTHWAQEYRITAESRAVAQQIAAELYTKDVKALLTFTIDERTP